MKERTKNLYIKSWAVSEKAIEAKLASLSLEWRRIGRQFFLVVTQETYDDVLAAITPLNQQNGSVIRESEIDYVNGSQKDIIRYLTEAYGVENVIVSIPSKEE